MCLFRWVEGRWFVWLLPVGWLVGKGCVENVLVLVLNRRYNRGWGGREVILPLYVENEALKSRSTKSSMVAPQVI